MSVPEDQDKPPCLTVSAALLSRCSPLTTLLSHFELTGDSHLGLLNAAAD